MPATEEDRATAASALTDHPDPVGPTALWTMTSLGALDGTVALLAAQGALSSWGGAVGVGLTVIAGAGAWITARQAFGGRRKTARDWITMGLLAVATGLAALMSAWLGGQVGSSVALHVLPHAAGLVLLLVAAQVGGIRLPRAGPVPLPALVLVGAVLAEGVVQWTL